MRQVIDAAAQFPTLVFTSALLVTLCFWLLVLLGRADVRAFDADAPSVAATLRTPVTVAASIAITSAWLVSLAGSLLLGPAGLTGISGAVARIMLLGLSAVIAWWVTRGVTAALAKVLLPDDPGRRAKDLSAGPPFDPGSRHPRG